jgi:hypothetical protein
MMVHTPFFALEEAIKSKRLILPLGLCLCLLEVMLRQVQMGLALVRRSNIQETYPCRQMGFLF